MKSKKGISVLSIFDGMSCGQIALERAGINVNNYFASEIDKYAITVTQANYPNTIQLGDVTKWREWDIDWANIDLLIGGSPCQGFSFAGKQLAFDDPRSKLFFVYVDILNHIKKHNPKVKFLLENVRMKKEFLDVISEQLGVQPVFINSALLSAQNRQRYYWANWEFEQPQDKGVLLRDILEETNNELRPCERIKEGNEGHIANTTDIKGMDCIKRVYGQDGKAPTLTTMGGGHREPKVLINESRRQLVFNPAAIVGRKLDENGKRNDSLNQKPVQCLEVQPHGKSRCLSTVQKDTVVSPLPPGRYPLTEKSQTILATLYKENAKSMVKRNKRGLLVCSETEDFGEHEAEGIFYRKLTPLECERLQTIPDNYSAHVSNTQRYRMLGNGWTVDVIAHIFNSIESANEAKAIT